MSAFGTKKRGSDEAVQLTFPANFAKAYDLGYAYFPSGEYHHPDVMVGEDFQSQYHAEKKRYADRNVMNFLHNNKTSERLMMTGHQNYHLPKPVLSQRKFANPSLGAITTTSARRDDGDAPFQTIETGMRGGVLASYEGQQYYRTKLEERSEQLSRINTLATGTPVPIESVSRLYDTKKIGSIDKVNFFLGLNLLVDSLVDGDISRFSFEDLKNMLAYLFRLGPSATMEELGAIVKGLDGPLATLEDALSENPVTTRGFNIRPVGGEDTGRDNLLRNYGLTLQSYLERARDYVVEMVRVVYNTATERKQASDIAIKTLGFDKLVGLPNAIAASREVARIDGRARQAREDFDGEDGGDDDEDGDGRFFDFGNRFRFVTAADYFRGRTREDEENAQPRQPYAGRGFDENREQFGRRNGAVVYGETAFFDAPRDYVPLSVSGFDPAAEGVPIDPSRLEESVVSTISQLLSELSPDGGATASVQQVIADNYGDPQQFVDEVISRLEGNGFPKSHIARGLQGVSDPYLRRLFSEYVARNSGSIAVERIAPSATTTMMGNTNVPMSSSASSMLPQMEMQSRETQSYESGGRTYPPIRDARRIIDEMGLPQSQAEFTANFRTIQQIKTVAVNLPKEYGGPYIPRDTTNPKNAREELNKRIHNNLLPTW